MKEPLKVILVDHESVLGGAEVSMVSMVKTMPSDKVQYSAAIAGEGEFAEALRNAGAVKIDFLPMDGWRWWVTGFAGRLKLLLSLPKQLLNTIRWYSYFKKNKPDIIHFNLSRLVEPVWAASFTRIPTVLHYREGQKSNSIFFGGLKALFVHFSLCDTWIANSAHTYRAILPFSKKQSRVKMLNNGIEIPAPAQKTGRFGKNVKVIAKVGTIGRIKNFEYYIDLAAEILKTRQDFIFLIAGKGNEEYVNQLKERARLKGVDKNMQWLGFTDNIYELLKEIDILVHCSGVESFGRIYIEAMAMEKPVVALKGDAAEDIVIQNETGLLFDAAQLSEMARSVIALADDKERRSEMGKKGRQRVIENFSVDRVRDGLLNIYEELMNESRRKTTHG